MKVKIKIFLIAIIFISSSCQRTSDTAVYEGVANRAISLNMDNILLYDITIENIKGNENEEVLKLMAEAAHTINKLERSYIILSGISTTLIDSLGNRPIYSEKIEDVSRYGEKGIEVYLNYELNPKLASIFKIMQTHKIPNEIKPIVISWNEQVYDAFFSDNPYYNREKLSKTPFALIALELAIMENSTYIMINDYITQTKNNELLTRYKSNPAGV